MRRMHRAGRPLDAAKRHSLALLWLPAVAVLFGLAAAGPVAVAKDVGPADARCDGFDKAGAEWRRCASQVAALPAATDSERFYAGYWLAKSGSYRAALDQLLAIPRPDVRALTYIGFAYRKIGDMDAALAHYGRAIGTDPGFTVARAYLGEAFLTLGRRERAGAELAEIEVRCGRHCAEYADLAGHIAAFDAAAAARDRKG